MAARLAARCDGRGAIFWPCGDERGLRVCDVDNRYGTDHRAGHAALVLRACSKGFQPALRPF